MFHIIINSIIASFELVISIYFCAIFTQKRIDKKQFIKTLLMSIAIGVCLAIIQDKFTNRLLYFAILLVSIMIIQLLINQQLHIKYLCASIVYFVILIVLRISCYIFLNNKRFEVVYIKEMGIKWQWLNVDFSHVLSVLLIGVFVYTIYKSLEINYKLILKYMITFYLVFALILVLDFMIIEKLIYEINLELGITCLVFTFVLILFFFLFIKVNFLINQIQLKNKEIEFIKLEKQMAYNSQLKMQNIYKTWSQNIHDYKHKIITLKRWCDNNEINKISEFLVRENDIMNTSTLGRLSGDKGIDSIIDSKYVVAKNNNIKMYIDVDVNKIMISDMDIVCLLGNLLDNAIDVCSRIDNSKIEVIIKEINNIVFIKILNSIDKSVNLKKTDKKDKMYHGIGIKSIKNIVEKYNGTYEVEQSQHEFVTYISLNNNIIDEKGTIDRI